MKPIKTCKNTNKWIILFYSGLILLRSSNIFRYPQQLSQPWYLLISFDNPHILSYLLINFDILLYHLNMLSLPTCLSQSSKWSCHRQRHGCRKPFSPCGSLLGKKLPAGPMPKFPCKTWDFLPHTPPLLMQNSSDLGHFEMKILFFGIFFLFFFKLFPKIPKIRKCPADKIRDPCDFYSRALPYAKRGTTTTPRRFQIQSKCPALAA